MEKNAAGPKITGWIPYWNAIKRYVKAGNRFTGK
jgi:hypothetical protein